MNMRKYSSLLYFCLALALFSLGLSSCKSDEPFVKPKLSFSKSTQATNEANGTIDVTVRLDKATTENFTVSYELKGTAVDKVAASTVNSNYDYEIASDYLEVKFNVGDTSAIIKVKLYSDFSFENDETIEIQIKTADSQNIEITRDDKTTITVVQEDGLIVLLGWPKPTTDSLADMDILLRVGANITTWDGIIAGSADQNFTGPEALFIPKAPDFSAYGLSYVYYEGTFKNLQFTTTFVDWINGAAEPEAQRQTFNATYTAANINKWTDPKTTQVVQTFLKSDGSFTAPSEIAVPVNGSRIVSSNNGFSYEVKKSRKNPEEFNAIQSLLNKLGGN